MKRKIWELGNHSCGNTPSPVMVEKGCGLCFMGNKKRFLPVLCKPREGIRHDIKEQARSVLGPRDRVDGRMSPFPPVVQGGFLKEVRSGLLAQAHPTFPGLASAQCSHPCVQIPWKPLFLGPAKCTHGSYPFLTFPGPPYTSQRTGSPQNKKHFQVVRTGARAWLIGSETSSEQWPRRKL